MWISNKYLFIFKCRKCRLLTSTECSSISVRFFFSSASQQTHNFILQCIFITNCLLFQWILSLIRLNSEQKGDLFLYLWMRTSCMKSKLCAVESFETGNWRCKHWAYYHTGKIVFAFDKVNWMESSFFWTSLVYSFCQTEIFRQFWLAIFSSFISSAINSVWFRNKFHVLLSTFSFLIMAVNVE